MRFIYIFIGKVIVKILRLFGRNAGNLPGVILQGITKNYLRIFRIDCPVIACTGTNGKTTVNNFIANILKAEGKKIITNPEGNNLDTGICSLLLRNCSFSGKVDADYLVLEVDESHVPVIFSSIKLETLVVLNFFRDQLDRNGEVETLILKLNRFCKTFTGNLVLNADDPNVVRLGMANPKNKNVRYFSVDKYRYATSSLYEVGEGHFCPRCRTALKYDYYQYSHIGRFHCPKCGYGNNELYAEFTNVDLAKRQFTADGKTYQTSFNSIYSMYNLCAVYSVAKLYKFNDNTVRKVFANFKVNNGRMEEFTYHDSRLVLNLAKNPVGANMTLRTLNETEGEKELLFVLNDNIADGCDVSWIWDINFSIFKNVDRVVTSGTRAYDIAIRIKYSGYDYTRIIVCPDLDDAVREIFSTSGQKFAIANYSAVQPVRTALKKFTK
jgi:UDP-N-acetylmuramyl tripeptide synthase